MGVLYAFECKGCGYEAEISGGPDPGMICQTRTILSRTCRELFDVPVLFESKDRWVRRKNSNDLARWEHPGACPRCGAELVNGGETCLWD